MDTNTVTLDNNVNTDNTVVDLTKLSNDDLAAELARRMAESEKDAIAIATGSGSKSDKIRSLASLGYSRSRIAKALDIRYQHVRNVLISPPKKA